MKYLESLKEGWMLICLKLFFIFVVTTGMVYEFNNEFNDGWEDGWCEGYRETIENPWAICPLSPLAPLPPLGRDNYKGGFALGYKASIKYYE